jgi:hypothetical protein
MHSGQTLAAAKARGEANLLSFAWDAQGETAAALPSAEVALRLLHQSWCRVHLYAERLRALVDGSEANDGLVGPTFAAGRDGHRVETGEQVRALAKLEADERDRCARFAKLCHDMRIDERQIELQQGQAQLVVSAFLASLGVVELLPVDRDSMLRAFLAGLGRGGELEAAGGAV